MSNDLYMNRSFFPGQPVHVIEQREIYKAERLVNVELKVRKLYQKKDLPFIDNGDGKRITFTPFKDKTIQMF